MIIGRTLQQVGFKIRQNYRAMIINLICFIGIAALGTNTFRVLQVGVQRYRLIAQERVDLEAVQEEGLRLESDLGWYSSLEFVEMQSRDYLNLANEGDSVLVLPDSEATRRISSESSESTESRISPSIDLWIKLLF